MITDAILIAILGVELVCWVWFLFLLAPHVVDILLTHPYLAAGLIVTKAFVLAMGWPRKL